MNDREKWLHGWPRLNGGSAVLMGTNVLCIGCGRDVGVTTVAITEGWKPPGPTPDWPFDEANCPVCATRERFQQEVEKAFGTWPPRAVHLYKRLKELEARLPANSRRKSVRMAVSFRYVSPLRACIVIGRCDCLGPRGRPSG